MVPKNPNKVVRVVSEANTPKRESVASKPSRRGDSSNRSSVVSLHERFSTKLAELMLLAQESAEIGSGDPARLDNGGLPEVGDVGSQDSDRKRELRRLRSKTDNAEAKTSETPRTSRNGTSGRKSRFQTAPVHRQTKYSMTESITMGSSDESETAIESDDLANGTERTTPDDYSVMDEQEIHDLESLVSDFMRRATRGSEQPGCEEQLQSLVKSSVRASLHSVARSQRQSRMVASDVQVCEEDVLEQEVLRLRMEAEERLEQWNKDISALRDVQSREIVYLTQLERLRVQLEQHEREAREFRSRVATLEAENSWLRTRIQVHDELRLAEASPIWSPGQSGTVSRSSPPRGGLLLTAASRGVPLSPMPPLLPPFATMADGVFLVANSAGQSPPSHNRSPSPAIRHGPHSPVLHARAPSSDLRHPPPSPLNPWTPSATRTPVHCPSPAGGSLGVPRGMKLAPGVACIPGGSITMPMGVASPIASPRLPQGVASLPASLTMPTVASSLPASLTVPPGRLREGPSQAVAAEVSRLASPR